VSKDEAATLQALAIDRKDDPDWLFRQCHRIVKALSGGNFVLAQIYGLNIPVIELDPGQLQKLASTARAIKANFSPDQPRDIADGGLMKVTLERRCRRRAHREKQGLNPPTL